MVVKKLIRLKTSLLPDQKKTEVADLIFKPYANTQIVRSFEPHPNFPRQYGWNEFIDEIHPEPNWSINNSTAGSIGHFNTTLTLDQVLYCIKYDNTPDSYGLRKDYINKLIAKFALTLPDAEKPKATEIIVEAMKTTESESIAFNTPGFVSFVNGRDHIYKFDSKGNVIGTERGAIVHQKFSDDKIVIKIDNLNKNVSQINLNNSVERKALQKVLAYIAWDLGARNLKYGLKSDVDSNNQRSSVAFTNPNIKNKDYNIAYLNTHGGFDSNYDCVHNIKNIIKHEYQHQLDNIKVEKDPNFKLSLDTHINVYIEQIKDPSFKNATQNFRGGIVDLFSAYVMNIYSTYNAGTPLKIENYIKQFNDLNTGFVISMPSDYVSGKPYPSNTIFQLYITSPYPGVIPYKATYTYFKD